MAANAEGMPNTFVLIRHGESEANVIQRHDKEGRYHDLMQAVYERPDWEQRLSVQGIEQARKAGRWLIKEFGGVDAFDLKISSPFMRTRETALYLTNPDLDPTDEEAVEAAMGDWIYDDRLVERHWGMYGTLPIKEQQRMFPKTYELKKRDPWYTALDGGESQASGVRLRVRDLHDTLIRDATSRNVLAVTHGEFMWTERQVLEGLLPEEYVAMDGDKTQRIRNCAALEYSRINPEDATDIDKKVRWMRFIYTDEPENSPYNGEWREIERKRRFTAAEMIAQLALAPQLLGNTEIESSPRRNFSVYLKKVFRLATKVPRTSR